MATRLQRLRRGGVTESFPFAGPQFRRAAPWLLAAIGFVALLVRLWPAVRYGVWGSDSGEYVFLTRQLVEEGRVRLDYHGWGLAYPYFPGMFVAGGAVSAMLGVDVFHATLWTTPVLAASLPILVGLLGYRITSDPRVAIVAGAFVATSSTVVLTTSHAMPGTLGQVVLFALLALLPDAHRDPRHLPLLAVFGVALAWTHHLTTYFAVGILAFVAFYREISQRGTDWPRLRTDGGMALFLLALAAVWWLVVATPFRDEIVGDALPLNPWITAALFLAALASLPFLVRLKRRHSDWYKMPRYPAFRRQWMGALAMGVGTWLVIAFAAFVRLPASSITISPLALLFSLPVLAFLAFLPLGASAVRFHRNGVILVAGTYAILASLAFAIATNSRVLFPFRHVDYLVMLMAPLCAVGMLMVYDQALASKIPPERPRARATLVAAFAGLAVLSLALSFPPASVIGGFQEGISEDELAAVRWVADHPEVIPPNSTMAADHRVSSLLWGLAGIRATWDYTPATYHSENATDAVKELNASFVPYTGVPTRIDYVLVSKDIERGVALTQWENSKPMSPGAIAKFEGPPFVKVYDERGVRIYRVDWARVTEA